MNEDWVFVDGFEESSIATEGDFVNVERVVQHSETVQERQLVAANSRRVTRHQIENLLDVAQEVQVQVIQDRKRCKTNPKHHGSLISHSNSRRPCSNLTLQKRVTPRTAVRQSKNHSRRK